VTVAQADSSESRRHTVSTLNRFLSCCGCVSWPHRNPWPGDPSGSGGKRRAATTPSGVDMNVDTLGKILPETRNRTEANLKIAR